MIQISKRELLKAWRFSMNAFSASMNWTGMINTGKSSRLYSEGLDNDAKEEGTDEHEDTEDEGTVDEGAEEKGTEHPLLSKQMSGIWILGSSKL